MCCPISNTEISCGILDLYPREPLKHCQHTSWSHLWVVGKLEKSLIWWDNSIAVSMNGLVCVFVYVCVFADRWLQTLAGP